MKRSTLVWLVIIGMLAAVIGWEMVWAVNTINQSAQQVRQEALAEGEFVPSVGGPELFLSPPISRLTPEETLNVDIVLKPAGQKVTGVDLILNFDPAVISIIDVVADQPGVQILSREVTVDPVVNQADNQSGRITFSALTNPGQTISSPTVLATIIIEALDPGRTKLSFEHLPGSTTDTNIAGINSQDILDRTLGAEYVVAGREKL